LEGEEYPSQERLERVLHELSSWTACTDGRYRAMIEFALGQSWHKFDAVAHPALPGESGFGAQPEAEETRQRQETVPSRAEAASRLAWLRGRLSGIWNNPREPWWVRISAAESMWSQERHLR
jgi:hypothetical protein